MKDIVVDYITTGPHVGLHLAKFGTGHTTDYFELVEAANPAPTPHKWAKEIKAWADGAEIEIRSLTPHGWTPWHVLDSTPGWFTTSTYEYRIKPEKKPDVVLTRHISKRHIVDIVSNTTDAPNVQYTFDGETGKLTAVQLLSN